MPLTDGKLYRERGSSERNRFHLSGKYRYIRRKRGAADLTVTVISIGKADAILVETEGHSC